MSDSHDSDQLQGATTRAKPQAKSVSLSSKYLYHAAALADWNQRTATEYLPSGYDNEGFIHLSTASQLLTPLHSFYLGRSDLLLLTIEEERVSVPLIWEDLYDGGQEFPHAYGPLNLDSIIAVSELPCDNLGRFDWVTESE